MLKQIEINKKWGSYEEICSLHKIEKDGKVKNRLLIIVLAYEGLKSEEIAKIVKLTGVTIRKHMKRYNRRGVNGLKDKPRHGGEPRLTEAEVAETNQILQRAPREAGMEVNNWRGWVLAKWIIQRFNKEVENISLMYFPSYCSDLNSIEHLWKDTRTNVTHNTLFDTFDLMVDNLKLYFADLNLFPRKFLNLCPLIY